MPKGIKGFVKGQPRAITAGAQKGKLQKKTRLRRISEQNALKYLTNAILKEWQPLIDAKMELAKGAWVQKCDNEGHKIVYQELPDAKSLEYLFNRVCGTATDVPPQEQIPRIVYVNSGGGNVIVNTHKGNGNGNGKHKGGNGSNGGNGGK